MKRMILITTLAAFAAVGTFAQSTGSAQPAQGSTTPAKPAVKKHSKKGKKSTKPAGSTAPAAKTASSPVKK